MEEDRRVRLKAKIEDMEHSIYLLSTLYIGDDRTDKKIRSLKTRVKIFKKEIKNG